MKSKKDQAENPFRAPLPEGSSVYAKGLYDALPAFPIEEGTIGTGFNVLCDHILAAVPGGLRVLAIDGYPGVDWPAFADTLRSQLENHAIEFEIVDFATCRCNPVSLGKALEPFSGGGDRIFGTHFPFGPEVFFDAEKVARMRIDAAIHRSRQAGKVTIIAGTGASLIELWDELWYIDIPKDVIQQRFRDGRTQNIGHAAADFEEFYKRCYFIEWPAFNRLKRNVLPLIDLFIDGQNTIEPASMSGAAFRQALQQLTRAPFRARPWFFPGPWGGQYMKWHMDLEKEQPNYAWSFELIVPENGIIFRSGERFLECSFDFAMFMDYTAILGEEAGRQFKYEWPIRLDYLDTIDGGNLSVQVHPRPRYIKKEFGETYTQDECYYIVNAKPESRVFLGLHEDVNLDQFKMELQKSAGEEKALDVSRYIHSEPAAPHDLFCIPNGTVHCSGQGNLVLEISATPYIFTFKIYDYLRRDLQGKLRPINIERGFANIRPERKGSWVRENLIARPRLINSGRDWELYELYNKPFTFYTIVRLEFSSRYVLHTGGRGYAANLVRGEKIDVISAPDRRTRLAYLESMVIPAAAEKVTLVNQGEQKCKLILVYVKPGIGVSMPVNNPND